MKECTGCAGSIAQSEICDDFSPEASDQDEYGRVRYSDYCLTCGHTKECHEEILDVNQNTDSLP